jgi:hypothetical protein
MFENEEVAVVVVVAGVVGAAAAAVADCCDDEDGSGLRFADDEDDVIFVIRVISSVTRSFAALLGWGPVIAGLLIYWFALPIALHRCANLKAEYLRGACHRRVVCCWCQLVF